MVTPTSTPGSGLMEVIGLTISEGLCRSMSRLWILIWNRSQALEPSPRGLFFVVILRVLVGIRTGPFTLRFFSLAPLIRSAHTFSRDFTLRLVRVILIWWTATSGSTGVLPTSLKAMAAARPPDRLVPQESEPQWVRNKSRSNRLRCSGIAVTLNDSVHIIVLSKHVSSWGHIQQSITLVGNECFSTTPKPNFGKFFQVRLLFGKFQFPYLQQPSAIYPRTQHLSICYFQC